MGLVYDEFEQYIFIDAYSLYFKLSILQNNCAHLEFSEFKRNDDIDYDRLKNERETIENDTRYNVVLRKILIVSNGKQLGDQVHY